MLRVLQTSYQGREIVLECTHKKQFPPPQMYGSSAEDIDVLWRQGAISATQHQLLKTWQERCGLMVMGPRCLDCPLALKQNPRPGRPNVVETESWLEAKRRFHWEDMKEGKLQKVVEEGPDPEEVDLDGPDPEEVDEVEEPAPDEPDDLHEVGPEIPSDPEEAEGFLLNLSRVEETTFLDVPSESDDDIIDALAKEQ